MSAENDSELERTGYVLLTFFLYGGLTLLLFVLAGSYLVPASPVLVWAFAVPASILIGAIASRSRSARTFTSGVMWILDFLRWW